IPQLFDARAIYRGMGFLVGPPPLGFVASVRFLARATPDSTLAVFAMSLANRALSFRRSGDEFVAEYHVDVGFRTESTTVREIARDETVRVHRFQETLRTDESIIFQQFVVLRPGAYTVHVAVRDRNGPAFSGDDVLDTVPRPDGGTLGAPVAIYRGPGRAGLHAASPETRATLWHEFFKATDPVPLTPENEALDEYFGRLGIANVRFQEAGVPGWLTDRGEVFITLGEPDDVFDLGSEVTASGARGVRWEYTALRLTLYFQDQTGFGQYRLTPASRAEYQRVLAQVRRSR